MFNLVKLQERRTGHKTRETSVENYGELGVIPVYTERDTTFGEPRFLVNSLVSRIVSLKGYLSWCFL